MLIYSKLAKYPRIRSFVKGIYILLNTNLHNRRKIRGSHNSIQAQEAILNKVEFDIQGDNNTIIIRRGTIINKTHFYIRGSNHKVDIGCNCFLPGEVPSGLKIMTVC